MTNISKVLGILCYCIILLSSLLMPKPVQAAVAMSPVQGYTGTLVTVSGLSDGISYSVKWGSTTLKSGTVPGGGAIFFYVPEAPGGSHDIVVDNPTGTPVLTSSFDVLPFLAISPLSGSTGTQIAVAGRGFGAWEGGIYVTYNNAVITPPITAHGNGSWFAEFVAPVSPQGVNYIGAFGNVTSLYNVVKRPFTITPGISINPVSGCVGTSVTVKGTGFAALESDIKITFDKQVVKSGIISQPDGTWSTTFNVPASGEGARTIDASGLSTSSFSVPNAVFTVMASVFIDPDTGSVGNTINIIGKGFKEHENGIVITYDGKIIQSGITADAEGNWTTSVTIPSSTGGSHEFGAYGNVTTTLNCARTTLTVRPKIVIYPEGGNVGDAISIKGSGFESQSLISVTFGGEPIAAGVQTDPNGSFSISFSTPKGRHGPIDIVVSDSTGQTASGIFKVETIPPPIPQLLSPANNSRVGFIGSSRIDFDWTDVSDPSGVYYTLEISTQPNFPSSLIRITDLTSSQYSLSESEALPHGEYYWRVRAIDGANNASQWTGTYLVKVSFMTVELFIIIIAIVVIIIVIIILLFTVPPRRKSGM
jgi:hypothetical protein